MATCGYICPQCEGKGLLDDGTPCDWCAPADTTQQISKEEISTETWIRSVHEGDCCAG